MVATKAVDKDAGKDDHEKQADSFFYNKKLNGMCFSFIWSFCCAVMVGIVWWIPSFILGVIQDKKYEIFDDRRSGRPACCHIGLSGQCYYICRRFCGHCLFRRCHHRWFRTASAHFLHGLWLHDESRFYGRQDFGSQEFRHDFHGYFRCLCR